MRWISINSYTHSFTFTFLPGPRRKACLSRMAGTNPVLLWSCLSNQHKDDQDNISSLNQVNGQMPSRLGNEGHCMLHQPLNSICLTTPLFQSSWVSNVNLEVFLELIFYRLDEASTKETLSHNLYSKYSYIR